MDNVFLVIFRLTFLVFTRYSSSSFALNPYISLSDMSESQEMRTGPSMLDLMGKKSLNNTLSFEMYNVVFLKDFWERLLQPTVIQYNQMTLYCKNKVPYYSLTIRPMYCCY